MIKKFNQFNESFDNVNENATINTFKDLRDDYVKYKEYSDGKIKELTEAINILQRQNKELKNSNASLRSSNLSKQWDKDDSFFGSFFDTNRD